MKRLIFCALIVTGMHTPSTYAQMIVPDVPFFDENATVFVRGNDTTLLLDSQNIIHRPSNSAFLLNFIGNATMLFFNSTSETSKRICVEENGPVFTGVAPPSGQILLTREVDTQVSVVDHESGVESLSLNSQPMKLRDGAASSKTLLKHGLNALIFSAKNGAELWTHIASNVYASNAFIDKAPNSTIVLGKEFFSQIVGEEQKRLLSRYMSTYLATFSPNNLPLFSEVLSNYSLFSFKLELALVAFSPTEFTIDSVDLMEGGFKIHGKVTARDGANPRAVLSAQLNFYIGGQPITFAKHYFNVDIANFGLSVKLLTSVTNAQAPKIKVGQVSIDRDLQPSIQASSGRDSSLIHVAMHEFANAFISNIGGLETRIRDIINAAMKSTNMNDGVVIFAQSLADLRLDVGLLGLQVHESTLNIDISSEVSAIRDKKNKTRVIKWNGCDEGRAQPNVDIQKNQVQIGVSLDAVNQLLDAVWHAGKLEFELPQKNTLNYMNLDWIGLDRFEFRVQLLMPPILDDCNEDGTLRAQAGDLAVFLKGDFFNRPFDFEARLAITADVALDVQGNDIVFLTNNIQIVSVQVLEKGKLSYKNKMLFETILKDYVSKQINQGKIRIPLFDVHEPESLLLGLSGQIKNLSFRSNLGSLDLSAEISPQH